MMMKGRVLAIAMTTLAAGAVVAVASIELAGQAGGTFQPPANVPGAEAVKAFVVARMAGNFTPPKTPWGDPDIQGVFTTKDEANTPFERPEEWAGKRMEDVTPQEFAAAIAQRQQAAVERAPFAGGGEAEEGVAIAVPIHWFDNLAAKNSRPWFVIEPSDGKIPPVTPGAAAQEAPRRPRGTAGGLRDSYTDRSLTDRCVGSTAWRTPGIYGNSHEIIQTPEYVVFRYETHRASRMIRLHQPHLAAQIRPHYGDSIGWWDGNTLVVESVSFPDRVAYRGYSAKSMRLIERFTRIGPKTVEWSVTIDNPSVYARPWTYSYPMTEDNTQPIHEYACHEGNYGLANILTAGRVVGNRGAEPSR
jgi:hypothetical protein